MGSDIWNDKFTRIASRGDGGCGCGGCLNAGCNIFKIVCFDVFLLVDVIVIVFDKDDDNLLWDLMVVLTENEGEDLKSAEVDGSISSKASITVVASSESSSSGKVLNSR